MCRRRVCSAESPASDEPESPEDTCAGQALDERLMAALLLA